ncbi:unnamed protein product [Caenorhabditis brenneri]
MNSYVLITLLSTLLTSFMCSAACASVQVRGHLMCNGQPYAREQVQLWEPKTLGDELWDDMPTGTNGRFEIFSHGNDVTLFNIPFFGFGFHPYLWIPNYCGTKLEDGKRCTKNILKISIPEGYINPCQPQVYAFDIGTINMETEEGSHFNWVLRWLGLNQQCRTY